MDQSIPLASATVHLPGLVQAAESGEVLHISCHGKPVAVLFSEHAYQALQSQQHAASIWTAIAQWFGAGRPHRSDDSRLSLRVDELRQIDARRRQFSRRED